MTSGGGRWDVADAPEDTLSQEQLDAHRRAIEEEAERAILAERHRKAEEEVMHTHAGSGDSSCERRCRRTGRPSPEGFPRALS